MIFEVEIPSYSKAATAAFSSKSNTQIEKENFFYTASGKGALSLVLGYLRKLNFFENKMDEILVPQWIGYWVYNQCNQHVFCTRNITERTKALLVYHQYGFPQRMDKILEFAQENNLIIIEDCAHTLKSSYQGKPLGTFGDFSIYSFSKFLPCFTLGGVRYSPNTAEEFVNYATEKLRTSSETNTFFLDFVKFFSERARDKSNCFCQWATGLVPMAYSLYGTHIKASRRSINYFRSHCAAEVLLREKRFKLVCQELKEYGVCEHIDGESVAPYVIPLRLPANALSPCISKFKEKGIIVSPLRFDMNRFLLNPKFELIFPLFCHSGIDENLFFKMVEIIKRHCNENC